MGMSEEVGVRIVRMIFLPNYEPKIRSFLRVLDVIPGTAIRPQKS